MNTPRTIDAPLPKGVTDFLPEMAGRIGHIEETAQRIFRQWGFRRVITPLIEFQDVMAIGLGGELKDRAFRLDDRQTGRLLAIPADITPQVARIVATRMTSMPLPHRLYYMERVLRHTESQSGRSREILQAGVELIGLDSPEADAEMIAMAVEVLRSLGLAEFKIDIGHIDFFNGIMAESSLCAATQVRLREAIAKKDSSAVVEILDAEQLTDSIREQIMALPRLFGGREVVQAAERLAVNQRSRHALENIRQVLDILEIYGLSDYLTIDLGEIRGLDYHSGVTFEGFVPGHGEPVCSGGRYDDLTAKYGFQAPATGFAFNIMSLLAACDRLPGIDSRQGTDLLLVNYQDDRRTALKIAQHLRGLGLRIARDIIRRDLSGSRDYARSVGIPLVLVLGGEGSTSGQARLISIDDNTCQNVQMDQLTDREFLRRLCRNEVNTNG